MAGRHGAFDGFALGLRRSAVREDTHDLALQLVQILSRRAVVVFAQGDEQIAIAVEDHARAKVITRRQFRFLTENHVEVLQPAHVEGEPATTYSRAASRLNKALAQSVAINVSVARSSIQVPALDFRGAPGRLLAGRIAIADATVL